MSNRPELLTSSQAAPLLGVSRSTVNRWAKAQLLVPFVITGAGYLFDADDVRAFAARMLPREKAPTE